MSAVLTATAAGGAADLANKMKGLVSDSQAVARNPHNAAALAKLDDTIAGIGTLAL